MSRFTLRTYHVAVALTVAAIHPMRPALGETYTNAVSNTSGLVGYWRFTETTGDYLDSTSRGNVAVVHDNVIRGASGPRPVDGFAGFEADNAGAGFNSADGGEYLSIADPEDNAFDPMTGDLTYSFWFKGPSDGNDYVLLSKANGSRGGYYFERLDQFSGSFSNKLNVVMSPNAATPAIGPVGPVSNADSWTNAGVVLHRNRTAASTDYQASGVSLFINGSFFGNELSAAFDGAPGPEMNNSLPVLLGAFRVSADGPLLAYTGTMDELSMYNRSLSPAEIATLYQIAVSGTSPSIWNLSTGSAWETSGNWLGGLPGGAGSLAILGSAITADATVTLNSKVTVGTLRFDNVVRYTLAGSGTLALNDPAGAHLDVQNGNQTIATPLVMETDTTFNIVPSNRQLTLSGTVNAGPGITVHKIGAGTIISQTGLRVDKLDIQQGTIRTIAGTAPNEPARTMIIGSLSLAGGAGTSTSRLDLGNSSAILDYSGSSPIVSVKAMLKQGYASGSWNGMGIASRSAMTAAADSAVLHKTTLGYAEASQLGLTSFGGQTLADGTAIVIGYTLYGDSNLDGKVNTVDFNYLAGGFGSASPGWVSGDYNYDGTVDTLDFNSLTGNYGSVLAVPPLGSIVPEPASIGIVLTSILMAGRRARRSHISFKSYPRGRGGHI